MTSLVFFIFALQQFASAHHHGRHDHSCEKPTVYETVTLFPSTLASSSGPSNIQTPTSRSIPEDSVSIVTTWVTSTVTGTPLTISTSSLAKVKSDVSLTSVSTSSSSSLTPTANSNDGQDISTLTAIPEESTSTSSKTSPSQTLENLYAAATAVNMGVQATTQCGNTDDLTLPGMPWVVANSMYNANSMKSTDSQCTNFKQVLHDNNQQWSNGKSDGTYLVEWNSLTNIAKEDDTKDICKGYSNIGVGEGLKSKLSEISSIPTYYKFSRENTEGFRGSALYDFVLAPQKGLNEGTQTREFMLFIKNWGNQIPIGYDQGPVDTVQLFDKSWDIYSGENPDGVTVHTLFPESDFEGEFSGDLKDWLDAMATNGYITSDWYVNVGNAGVEVFYGNSEMNATVALDIQS